MPFIDKQVEILNQHLIGTLFSHVRFANGVIHGLAVLVAENDENTTDKRYPVVYNENDEPESVGVDDTYPLVVYHRALDNSYEVPEDAFGDVPNKIAQTANMVMVVYGSRSKLKLSPETLEGFTILAMPNNIEREVLSETNLDTLTVDVSRSELDPLTVFGEEFNGVDFSIEPDEFLFKIEYSFQSQYRKNCIDLCDCLE